MLVPVKSVQALFKDQGYYHGEVDDVWGSQSTSAALAALTANKIDIAGWSPQRVQIAAEQLFLKATGFDPGPIDGLTGAHTREAWLDWQTAHEGVSGKPVPAMLPLVADLSHHNKGPGGGPIDFVRAKAWGLRGIIHKATQGTTYADPDYAARYYAARKAGLLWGAYHFADRSDVETQVNHFLQVVQLTTDDDPAPVLLALDWEDVPHAPRMELAQVKHWLQLVYDRTGQRPVLYSGNVLKEVCPKGDAFLSQHRLWMPQYAAKPVLAAGFKEYFLWQETGDGIGPGPHHVDGIDGNNIDLNIFHGSADELPSRWTA